jgi:DNA-binding Xre family transcriptional regulator
MIANERQYAITRAQIERFQQALDGSAAQEAKLHPRALKAMRAGLESQLQDLRAEVAEYERLKGGEVASIVADSILDLARVLIQARIVRNWTQRELAERLALPEQQIQRYEATLYKGVAVERLQEVADALKLRVREVVTLDPV